MIPAAESAKAASPSDMVLKSATPEVELPSTTGSNDLSSPWDLPEKPRDAK